MNHLSGVLYQYYIRSAIKKHIRGRYDFDRLLWLKIYLPSCGWHPVPVAACHPRPPRRSSVSTAQRTVHVASWQLAEGTIPSQGWPDRRRVAASDCFWMSCWTPMNPVEIYNTKLYIQVITNSESRVKWRPLVLFLGALKFSCICYAFYIFSQPTFGLTAVEKF